MSAHTSTRLGTSRFVTPVGDGGKKGSGGGGGWRWTQKSTQEKTGPGEERRKERVGGGYMRSE